MKREDLSADVSMTGYMLRYRGQPIGGAGTLKKSKNWQNQRADLKMYRENAEREIEHLVAGNGQARFLDAIKKIESAA